MSVNTSTVAELGDLVADGEEPAARRLRLLGHVVAALAGAPCLEAGALEVVEPDRRLVPATSSRRPSSLPRNVHETSNWPIAPRLEPDQRDRVVLGLDRVHERVGPAHHPRSRRLSLPMKIADDLDAVAAEVDDRPAARLLRCPEPRERCGPGMRLARAGPESPRRSTPSGNPCGAPSASSACRRGPPGSRRRCRPARPCRGSAWPPRRCARGASCRGRPCRASRRARRPPRAARSAARSRPCRSGVRDRLLEVGRPLRDVVVGANARARSSERE